MQDLDALNAHARVLFEYLPLRPDDVTCVVSDLSHGYGRVIDEGWFRTGDQFIRNQGGRYRFVGRARHTIKRGGILGSVRDVLNGAKRNVADVPIQHKDNVTRRQILALSDNPLGRLGRCWAEFLHAMVRWSAYADGAGPAAARGAT